MVDVAGRAGPRTFGEAAHRRRRKPINFFYGIIIVIFYVIIINVNIFRIINVISLFFRGFRIKERLDGVVNVVGFFFILGLEIL